MKMTAAEIEQFLATQFPAAVDLARIEHIGDRTMRVRAPFKEAYLRPGGTLSGPALMGLADSAVYFLILAELGPVALAVTSSLTIHFLRRPAARDAIAEVRLLRLGKRTAVGDVMLYVDGEAEPVAHAVASYALPPR
jgi:uncharacterized protein (TIGR00369 family)